MNSSEYFAHCRAEADAARGHAIDAPEHMPSGAIRLGSCGYAVTALLIRDGDTFAHQPRHCFYEEAAA